MRELLLRKNKEGFTLIELLIVITLVGLLTGFLVPEMMNFNRRQKLQSSVTEIVDEIKRAQSLATSGVQSDTDFTAAYRFTFTKPVSGPVNYYDGFRLNQVNESANEVTPPLNTGAATCPVCVQSSVASIDFSVPTGRVSGFTGSQHAALVCYPGQGHYTVTVDQSGRVYTSNFIASACSCPINSC